MTVDQSGLASFLGVTQRQLRNLEKAGMPRRNDGLYTTEAVLYWAHFLCESRRTPGAVELELQAAIMEAISSTHTDGTVFFDGLVKGFQLATRLVSSGRCLDVPVCESMELTELPELEPLDFDKNGTEPL